MKLRKQKLIKLVKDGLHSLGYEEFKDTQLGTSGLFCKYVGEGFFLTLGLEISRLYECSYTASYYLSKTTRWASLGFDIPRKCWQRIGELLTDEERFSYFGENSLVRDKWWDSIEIDEVNDFLEKVSKTQSRIVEDRRLKQEIEESVEIARQCRVDQLIQRVVLSPQQEVLQGIEFEYLPERNIESIPLIWFKAAEYVRRFEEKEPKVDKAWVFLDAADAYRMYTLVSKDR